MTCNAFPRGNSLRNGFCTLEPAGEEMEYCYLMFHDGYDTHACVPKRHFGVQARTMKIVRVFWLGLRLRSPFRLGSAGYGNFLRRRTSPNDDTGIVAVPLRRDIYFLTNPQYHERSSPDSVFNDRACQIEDRFGPIDNGCVTRGDDSTEFKENPLRNLDRQGFSRKSFLL